MPESALSSKRSLTELFSSVLTGTIFSLPGKRGMTLFRSSEASRRLLVQFIRENIDYNRRCSYLQELSGWAKKDDIWRRALLAYLDTSITEPASYPTFQLQLIRFILLIIPTRCFAWVEGKNNFRRYDSSWQNPMITIISNDLFTHCL